MSQLEELLQQCTVKLTLPGRIGWGTGFFVAPGLILTCAHVVRQAPNNQIEIFWPFQDQLLSATLQEKFDDGKTLDIALLALTEPYPNHCCVLLDEASVATGRQLYSYGYLKSYPNAAPVRCISEGLTGDIPPLLKFQAGQIEEGLSGAALIDLSTGKVCGMVKESRASTFDLGGGAVPTRVILEQLPQLREFQQQFHQCDRRWSDLVAKQSEIDFEPYLQSILDDEDYREWQDVYTPTTVEDWNRSPQPKFSPRLKLRVETVKPPKEEQEQREPVEPLDVLEELRKYAVDHVLLIGKPGSGKSTSLERLLWEEAGNALNTPNAKIPVLVKLRRCTSTIEGLIRDFLSRHQLSLDVTEIEKLLRQGKLLLLLDGLNELPEAFRTEIANFRDRYRSTTPNRSRVRSKPVGDVQEISPRPRVPVSPCQSQPTTYDHTHRSTTPMIFSTRDLSVGGNLSIDKTLKMLPLTELQMQEFVRGYLGEEGNRLFQQLKGEQLRKFAETPLLLWMLCRVFAEKGQVPANLGLAFREFTQLDYPEIQQDTPADSRDQWPKLLRHLAFALMHDKEPTDFRLSMPREEAENLLTDCLRQEGRANPRDCAERWLKDLLDYHLIQPVIQPNFEEHIEFRHQLIQEYYAAEYLLRLLLDLSDEQLKRDYLNYLKWTESLALMLALLDEEAQALRVVKLAMNDVDLMLAGRLAGEVQFTFQEKTINLISSLPNTPQWLKCRLFEKSRSDYAIERLANYLLDNDWFIRRNALESLGRIGTEKAAFHLLRGLKDKEPAVISETAIWLRKLSYDSLIQDLIELVDELDGYAQDKTISIKMILLEKPENLKRFQLIINKSKAIKRLLKFRQDYLTSENQKRSRSIPLIVPEEDIDGTIEEFDGLISINIKEINELIVSVEYVISIFQECLLEGEIRENLLKELERHLIPRLEVVSRSTNREIFRQAHFLLESVMHLVNNVTEDSDWRVRKTLVEFIDGTMNCICNSKEDFSNSDETKRFSEEITSALLRLSADSCEDVREKAIYALSKIPTQDIAPTFRDAFNDSNFFVRCSAAKALGKLRDAQAIPALLKLLNDEIIDVRSAAAIALGEISKQTTLLAEHLSYLMNLIYEDSDGIVQGLIATVQSNYKFYNYEIWQDAIQNEKLGIKNGEQGAAGGQTTNIVNIETLNAPNAALNLGGIIHGDQTGIQSH